MKLAAIKARRETKATYKKPIWNPRESARCPMTTGEMPPKVKAKDLS
jgi:hypothetical protein